MITDMVAAVQEMMLSELLFGLLSHSFSVVCVSVCALLEQSRDNSVNRIDRKWWPQRWTVVWTVALVCMAVVEGLDNLWPVKILMLFQFRQILVSMELVHQLAPLTNTQLLINLLMLKLNMVFPITMLLTTLLLILIILSISLLLPHTSSLPLILITLSISHLLPHTSSHLQRLTSSQWLTLMVLWLHLCERTS